MKILILFRDFPCLLFDILFGLDPASIRELSTEPGPLPLRKLTGADLYFFFGFFQTPLTVQILHDLPVTNGLHRRAVFLQTIFKERFCFLNQSSLKHFFDPLIDTFY